MNSVVFLPKNLRPVCLLNFKCLNSFFGLLTDTHCIIDGSSNMTGTNCDLFAHKQSQSYLNHLVEEAGIQMRNAKACWLRDVVLSHNIVITRYISSPITLKNFMRLFTLAVAVHVSTAILILVEHLLNCFWMTFRATVTFLFFDALRSFSFKARNICWNNLMPLQPNLSDKVKHTRSLKTFYQKALDRERLSSCSTSIMDKQLVGPEFKPLSTHNFRQSQISGLKPQSPNHFFFVILTLASHKTYGPLL
jgi:hypothetical protein